MDTLSNAIEYLRHDVSRLSLNLGESGTNQSPCWSMALRRAPNARDAARRCAASSSGSEVQQSALAAS
ncbi:MAG: hypothetical protein R2849_16750 [Thermomicrobiales bacterium]